MPTLAFDQVKRPDTTRPFLRGRGVYYCRHHADRDPRYRRGGGTFTDVTFADAAIGATWVAKTPSTPDDLSGGFITAIKKVLALVGLTPPGSRLRTATGLSIYCPPFRDPSAFYRDLDFARRTRRAGFLDAYLGTAK